MVIAGDTNIHMDATTNPATEHSRAGWQACCFRGATAGGVEDMTPTLHPSRHRVDTFLVNEPLRLWSLREGDWDRGMAQSQVIGSDHLPFRLALPGLASMTHSAFETITDNDPEGILDRVLQLTRSGSSPCDLAAMSLNHPAQPWGHNFPIIAHLCLHVYLPGAMFAFFLLYGITVSTELWGSILRLGKSSIAKETSSVKIVTSGSCKCDRECHCVDGCIDLELRGAWAVPLHPDYVPPASPLCLNAGVCGHPDHCRFP